MDSSSNLCYYLFIMSKVLKISERIYQEQDVITFQKNKDTYGCFSNMFTNLSFMLNGIVIYTTEHLYQSLKFTQPEIQKEILNIKNPIDSKRKAYEFTSQGFSIRSDWELIKIDIMKYCIKLKSYHHCNYIGKKLIDSYQINLNGKIKSLVEKSNRDDFWGAKPNNLGQLKGRNVLGRLWMGVREEYCNNRNTITEPVKVPNCNLIFLGEELK